MKLSPVDKLVLSLTGIAGLIAVLIVGSVVTLAIIDAAFSETPVEIPSVLENWGGVVVGFFFGTFISLIKDYMRLKQSAVTGTGAEAPPPDANVEDEPN